MPLSFSKNNSTWGLSATSEDGLSLVFSGEYSMQKVLDFEQQFRVKKYWKIGTWLLLSIGLICLIFQTWFNYNAQNWLFLFKHEILNVPIILSILAAMYLWAQKKEEEKRQAVLNVFLYNQNWGSNQKNNSVKELDVLDLFSPWAQVAWQEAVKKSLLKNLPALSLNELLLSLLNTSEVSESCFRLSINSKELKQFLENNPTEAKKLSDILKVPFLAFETAQILHNKSLDPLMLFCACVKTAGENSSLGKLFVKLNVSQEKLETVCSWIFNLKILRDEIRLFKKLSGLKPLGNMNIGLTAIPTPHLDRFTTDLSLNARLGRLPLALGRHEDFKEIFQLFSQNSRQILIKGEAGTGRSTLINELAFKMATEQVPKTLQDKRLLKIEISGILGAQNKSEASLESLLSEAAHSGNIVLVIEDIEQLAKARSASGLNLLEILVNFLQNTSLQVIATCDLNSYVDFLQNTPNFTSVFSEYELKQLNSKQIALAACIKASLLEHKHNCIFLFQSIERAIELTNELIHGLGQPQKTIQLLSETASKNKSTATGPNIITPGDIEKTISLKTHIPEGQVLEKEADKLLNLEKVLAKSIVGQKLAIKAVCEALRRARSGLSSTSRPLASFLFLGPTGVGKTEIAKTVAKEYFGKEEFLLRLDMSEFSSYDGMQKLLGQKGEPSDPPLIKHLKNYPYCLLLLDEFEKANQQIHNLFLQILDDGRLTTSRGELIDMRHVLIIATSNAGSKDISDGIKAGLTPDIIKTRLFDSALAKIFAPELLNRFDATIVFSPLMPEEMENIVALQLKVLQKKLETKGINLAFSKNVLKNIAKNAFDPSMGARPVRRYIQDHVESFIAELTLSKKIDRGFKGLVDLENGELTIS